MAIDMWDSNKIVKSFSIAKFGSLTTELYDRWSSQQSDSTNIQQQLEIKKIIQIFYDIECFPSSSQVHEMLCCANESAQRSSINALTFGEFCVYASEFKASPKKDPPTPLSKISELRANPAKKPKRTISNSSSNYEVFLGGSCNPTTWRKDIAIPLMKNMDITFYNPQVSHWGPELIELENQAKQNADVLFFVIDNQTRSVASIIEAAHLAGSRRKLVLVINAFEGSGDKVLGEPITDREFEDLKVGQAHLQDLVERQNIPVFKSIKTALQCAAKVIKKGITVQELTLADGAIPVQLTHIRPGEKIVKLREIFTTLDSNENGFINMSDVSMGIRILTKKSLTTDEMQSIYERCLASSLGHLNNIVYDFDAEIVSFDQFCCIVAEYKHQLKNKANKVCSETAVDRVSSAIHSVFEPLSKLFSWAIPKRSIQYVESHNTSQKYHEPSRDIFLGGSHGESLWRENIAIPTLKKHGITYYNPKMKCWMERMIPIQLAAVESSHVLLFVITNQTRSLASMAVAAHYAGLGCNMVLCIQYLSEGAIIGGEQLSKQAVKDYNRGRVYLSDLANRDGIPVFENIQDAVDCAVNKVKDLS